MMLARRNIVKYISQYKPVQSKVCSVSYPQIIQVPGLNFSSTSGVNGTFKLGKERWVAPSLLALKRRSDDLARRGLSPVDRRSTYIEWNLEAELTAFSARLGEEFDQSQLVAALMDQSHIEHERQNGNLTSADMESNEKLAAFGQELVEKYSTEFVKYSWPHVPEEAVRSILSFLCCDESMSEVGQSIGLKDLIFAEPYPPSTEVMARAARAVVGALAATHPHRVPAFVESFVATRLVGQRLWDMWQVSDPLAVLQQLLSHSGESAEPRLVKSAGRNTLEAVYQVALYYKNKTFLSTGFGESVNIAVAEAAREALDKLFGDTSCRPPLCFARASPPSCSNLPARPPSSGSDNLPLGEWSLSRADPRHGNIVVC